MKTIFKGIVGIFVFVIITTSQISAQDVIQGCINVKNGNLRIVSSSNECNHRESYISWNILGPQGPPGEQGDPGAAGADGLSCWDLNENHSCDTEEDKNNDGLCDALDCQAPPVEGNVKVYSADNSYLGILIDSAPGEAPNVPSSALPSITVYVPDLKKLFQVSTGHYGENIWDPIPVRVLEYIYFDGESCTGKPYIFPGMLGNIEKFQMLYHIVTYIHLNGDVKHYEVIYNQDDVISIKSRHSYWDKVCENYPIDSKYYELNEVDLPFPYPVDLPLSFK